MKKVLFLVLAFAIFIPELKANKCAQLYSLKLSELGAMAGSLKDLFQEETYTFGTISAKCIPRPLSCILFSTTADKDTPLNLSRDQVYVLYNAAGSQKKASSDDETLRITCYSKGCDIHLFGCPPDKSKLEIRLSQALKRL